MVKRASWLSVTPEPERELPRAVATLRHGRLPPPAAVDASASGSSGWCCTAASAAGSPTCTSVVGLIERRAAPSDPELAARPCARHRRARQPPQPAAGAARAAARSEPQLTGRGSRSSPRICTPRITQRKPHEHDDIPHDLTGRADPRPARAPAASARVRRERADAARARGRGARRRAARGDRRGRSSARRSRRGCNGGRFAARVRRPGLVDARVVRRQRAVRPRDQRPALARPQRLQRADAGHARADRALPAAGAARRGRRRLRGDRGRGRLGSGRDRHAPPWPPTRAGGSTARSGS